MESSSIEKQARRDELLLIARRYRSKWVLETSSNDNSSMKMKKKSQLSKEKSKVPAVECIDNVLKYLSDIADDGIYVDSEAILIDNGNQEVPDLAPVEDNSENIMFSEDPFLNLLEKMRRSAAFEVVNQIQLFVLKCDRVKREIRLNIKPRIESDYDLSPEIWKFIDRMSNLLKENSLWSNETPERFQKTIEALEKFVFIKLHSTLFAWDPEDIFLNQKTRERIDSLQFLSPEHLDIRFFPSSMDCTSPLSVEEWLASPIDHLRQLEHDRSPFDMLTSLRHCSQSISELLKVACDPKKRGLDMPGADDFLSVMILVIKCSKLSKVHSIIKYLQRYIRPSKLMSEAGYLLTQFVSAIHFLDNVDAQALTISPEEFESSMLKCKQSAALQLSTSNRKTGTHFQANEDARHDDECDRMERIKKNLRSFEKKFDGNITLNSSTSSWDLYDIYASISNPLVCITDKSAHNGNPKGRLGQSYHSKPSCSALLHSKIVRVKCSEARNFQHTLCGKCCKKKSNELDSSKGISMEFDSLSLK